jgi:hypothetical protein
MKEFSFGLEVDRWGNIAFRIGAISVPGKI